MVGTRKLLRSAAASRGGSSHPAHRIANLVGIMAPLLGLLLAVVLLWDRMVGPTELAILVVGYVLDGVGITVGFHRLFTHRSFQTYRGVRYTFAVLGQMARRGRRRDLGRRPPEAPSVLRSRGRPAQPARRLRRRRRSGRSGGSTTRTSAGCFARPDAPTRRATRKDLVRTAACGGSRSSSCRWCSLSLLVPAVIGWLLDRRLVRLPRRAGLGRRRPHLPAPPRDLVDQLDLPLLGRRRFEAGDESRNSGGSRGSRSASRGTTTTTRFPPRRSTACAGWRSTRRLADPRARAHRARLEGHACDARASAGARHHVDVGGRVSRTA